MGTATLTIDLDALANNWRRLNATSSAAVKTSAVVKADGYGLGAEAVARTLAEAGAQTFFVAVAEEGAAIRTALGAGPEIYVFSGHLPGDDAHLAAHDLTPMLNSVEQVTRHFESLPGHGFGIQLDTGMNRLGMEPEEWTAIRDIVLPQGPRMIMSHLACADEPGHPMNAKQLAVFGALTSDLDIPKSFSATGGILLGPEYHFDVTRPGIGLYGGAPFEDATAVVHLALPVIQTRTLQVGETVGYGNTWSAERESTIATVSGGYADGLIRAMGPKAKLYAGATACPVVGRVSMDLITVDVTDLESVPGSLDILCEHQPVDTLADAAGTIGYEILTSLGARYRRQMAGSTE